MIEAFISGLIGYVLGGASAYAVQRYLIPKLKEWAASIAAAK